ncbi:MAG: hypothetical protein M1505_01120 [Patescibacteria group bacterium]|nr:hypothetical protein [Patescibacteria group bacterium]MCL5257818.1 hypothetical protein [Patescibacteria group bacterium]
MKEITVTSFSFRRDKFFRDRDSYAEWWKISCVQCEQDILLDQKDEHGKLFRCYLNRIFAPTKYAELQNDKTMTVKKMPRFTCPKCNTLIGVPMFHREGRLAFKLIRENWVKYKLDEARAKEFKKDIG